MQHTIPIIEYDRIFYLTIEYEFVDFKKDHKEYLKSLCAYQISLKIKIVQMIQWGIKIILIC